MNMRMFLSVGINTPFGKLQTLNKWIYMSIIRKWIYRNTGVGVIGIKQPFTAFVSRKINGIFAAGFLFVNKI